MADTIGTPVAATPDLESPMETSALLASIPWSWGTCWGQNQDGQEHAGCGLGNVVQPPAQR